jgi:hypothetical protein
MKKLLGLALLFTSCSTIEKEDINCKYNGGVIYQVHKHWNNCYDIKYNGEILHYVYGYEINGEYKAGDTIKSLCIK